MSGAWRDATFREPERADPRRWIGRGIGLWTFLALLLLLNAQRRDSVRCDQDCYGTYRTFEPGHAWTNYDDAWQWDAQNAIVSAGFVAAIAGLVLVLASRRRKAVILTGVSMLLSAAYVLWVQLSPAIG
jgi:hypothetical protein